jgi:hypothetical protein
MSGQALLRRVVECLRGSDWTIEVDDDLGSVLVDTDTEWSVQVIVRDEDSRIIAYAIGLDDVSPQHRREVVDFTAMANSGLLVGNFEIDLDDGEIGVRVGVDLDGVTLDDDSLTALLNNMLGSALGVLEQYGAAIEAVAAGELDAVQAYARAQHGRM